MLNLYKFTKNITKKATAVLDADEMTMLVETLSQKNQVDSFNDYFATAANKKEVKKEAPVKAEKPAEAKKDKKPEIKPVGQNKPAQKPVQNNAQKPHQFVQNTNQKPSQPVFLSPEPELLLLLFQEQSSEDSPECNQQSLFSQSTLLL